MERNLLYLKYIVERGIYFMKKFFIAFLSIFIISGCSNTKTNDATKKSSQPIENTDTSKSSSTTSQSSSQVTSSQTSSDKGISSINMTIDEAKKIYENEYPNTSITAIDVDSSFGTYYFKVEGVDDNKEYELKINTSNSEIFKEREETLDKDEQNGVKKTNEAIDFSKLKTLKEIIDLAEPLFEGATATDAGLEKEVGVTYWDITLKKGSQEMEVKIDAVDGTILEKSMDD